MTKSNANAIFIHRIIYGVASSFIKVFIPIIIYKSTGNIYLALFFAAVKQLFAGAFTVVLKKFLVKKQFQSILLSIIPLLLIQVIISLFEINLLTTIILVVLAAVSNPLYYIPLNLHFVTQDKKHDVAKFQTGAILGKISFIVLSGYILGSSVDNSLLIISSIATILFLISLMPLFKNYKQLKESFKTIPLKSLKTANNMIKKENSFHMFFGFFSQAVATILPLYLFYANLSIDKVAYVVAITEVLKIGANYLAKYLMHKKLNVLNYIIACTFLLFSSLVIMFSTSLELLFVVGIVISLAFPFLMVSSFKTYSKTIKEKNIVAEGLILRDFYILAPRGLLYSMLIFAPFPVMFGVGAISSIGMYVFKLNKK